MEIPAGHNSSAKDGELIEQQVAYYRARAAEYDEWFLRQGRYDRGPEHRDLWIREISTIESALRPVVEGKVVLELACGTGQWTEHMAGPAARIFAIDASPEMIAINQGRVRSAKVEYCGADIFSWLPSTKFDVVFFSFWLSHVPPSRFEGFWTKVRGALRPDGVAFFIDNLPEPTSTARDHTPPDRSGTVRRRLNDGREFEITKVFYDPRTLERRLSEDGWRGSVRSTGKFFLYGLVRQTQSGK